MTVSATWHEAHTIAGVPATVAACAAGSAAGRQKSLSQMKTDAMPAVLRHGVPQAALPYPTTWQGTSLLSVLAIRAACRLCHPPASSSEALHWGQGTVVTGSNDMSAAGKEVGGIVVSSEIMLTFQGFPGSSNRRPAITP